MNKYFKNPQILTSFVFNPINSNDVTIKQKWENINEREKKKYKSYISRITLQNYLITLLIIKLKLFLKTIKY